MGKNKGKLTAAEKAEKQRRRTEFMTIFIRGKMKRVRRPPTIEGLPVEEFIRRNTVATARFSRPHARTVTERPCT